jgi:hypothetical protein
LGRKLILLKIVIFLKIRGPDLALPILEAISTLLGHSQCLLSASMFIPSSWIAVVIPKAGSSLIARKAN